MILVELARMADEARCVEAVCAALEDELGIENAAAMCKAQALPPGSALLARVTVRVYPGGSARIRREAALRARAAAAEAIGCDAAYVCAEVQNPGQERAEEEK